VCPPTISAPRLAHLVLPAAEDVGEHRERQPVRREADDVERGERLAAHGVHVGERVGRGHLAEVVRVVDDGSEEVDRLHERHVLGQHEHAGVVERLASDEEPGIGVARERRERGGQVTRTHLGRSAGAAGELRETKELVARVGRRHCR
jgi:hypothetical protein